jgi:hypothetical protein
LAGKEKQFVPHPATWLNGRRWEDDVAAIAPQGTPKAVPHQTAADAQQEEYLRSIGFYNDRPKPGTNAQSPSPAE